MGAGHFDFAAGRGGSRRCDGRGFVAAVIERDDLLQLGAGKFPARRFGHLPRKVRCPSQAMAGDRPRHAKPGAVGENLAASLHQQFRRRCLVLAGGMGLGPRKLSRRPRRLAATPQIAEPARCRATAKRAALSRFFFLTGFDCRPHRLKPHHGRRCGTREKLDGVSCRATPGSPRRLGRANRPVHEDFSRGSSGIPKLAISVPPSRHADVRRKSATELSPSQVPGSGRRAMGTPAARAQVRPRLAQPSEVGTLAKLLPRHGGERDLFLRPLPDLCVGFAHGVAPLAAFGGR